MINHLCGNVLSLWQKINKPELLSKRKVAFKSVRENGEDFDWALRGEEA